MMGGIGNILRYLPSRKYGIIILCSLLVIAAAIAGYIFINREAPINDLVKREIALLEEAIAQNPTDLDKRVELASMYTEAGLHEKAIEQLETTLELDEANRGALILLGYIYINTERYEEALQPFEQLIEIDKDSAMRHINRQLESVYYYTGIAYFNLDMFTDAIRSFQQAILIDNTDADAWYMLGLSNQHYGNYQEAIISFEQAIRFVPDFTEVYHGLSICYESTGQMNLSLYATAMENYCSGQSMEAISMLEEVIAIDSDFAQAYLGLGLAYESTDTIYKAIDAYENALRIKPDLWLARAKIEALRTGVE
ncbi:tetratricopeptide repeat protein [Chloroflexota bacterium]